MMRSILTAAAFVALAGCTTDPYRASVAPGCPITVGMPEARLTACYSAYVVDDVTGPAGELKIYDSNLPPGSGPRHVFVKNGTVYGWTSS